MSKQWRVVKHYICALKGQTCGDQVAMYDASEAPDCSDCPIYLEWKSSGLTKAEFQEQFQ